MLLTEKPTILAAENVASLTRDDAVLVLLWHLGDVLNSTALLPALASKHGRKLTFATSKSALPIVQNNPYLDKVIVLPFEAPSKLTMADLERMTALSENTFPAGVKVYNLHAPIDVRHFQLHIIQIWARAVGIDDSLKNLKPKYFPETTQLPLKLHYRDYLVLGNGGATGLKRWPIKRWNGLVERVSSRFPELQFLQLGSPDDPRIQNAEDLRGRTTIEESYLLLQGSIGCVTNDSFLGHLAGAAGCQTYVIFGSTSPRHYHPLGSDLVSVFGGDIACNPCQRNWCMLSLGLTTCWAFPSIDEIAAAVETDWENKTGRGATSNIAKSQPDTLHITRS